MNRPPAQLLTVLLVILVIGAGLTTEAEEIEPAREPVAEEGTETMRATGTFEIKLQPLETYNSAPDAQLARMSIDKTFAGELEGTSQGEMLTGGSPAEGNAGYVAIERVTGTLHGKSGSFTLQHSATMTPESQEQVVTVIPSSATGDLEGLAGSMRIEITDGQHFYDLVYSLP